MSAKEKLTKELEQYKAEKRVMHGPCTQTADNVKIAALLRIIELLERRKP